MLLASAVLLVATCAGMLVWGLRNSARFLQFPTLSAGVVSSFLIPQVFGVIRARTELLPPEVLEHHGLELMLVVCALCYGALHVGYVLVRRPLQDGLPEPPKYSDQRLFAYGCFLLLPAGYGYHGLTVLSGGGWLDYFSTTGNYALVWEGAAVRHVNLMRLVYPALACLLLATLTRPTPLRYCITGCAASLPVAIIVFLGRRSATAALALTVLLPLWFAGRWSIPRSFILIGIGAAAVVLYAFPDYRQYSLLGADKPEEERLLTTQPLMEAVDGSASRTTELVNSTIITTAVHESAKVGYGRSLWNSSVALLVPKQIVGERFKTELLSSYDYNAVSDETLGLRRREFTAINGPCSAFVDFWFFAPLTFLAIGYGMRRLWDSAMQGHLFGQLFYVVLAPASTAVMAYDIANLFFGLVTAVIALGPAMWFIRQNSTRYHQIGTRKARHFARPGNRVTQGQRQSPPGSDLAALPAKSNAHLRR